MRVHVPRIGFAIGTPSEGTGGVVPADAVAARATTAPRSDKVAAETKTRRRIAHSFCRAADGTAPGDCCSQQRRRAHRHDVHLGALTTAPTTVSGPSTTTPPATAHRAPCRVRCRLPFRVR